MFLNIVYTLKSILIDYLDDFKKKRQNNICATVNTGSALMVNSSCSIFSAWANTFTVVSRLLL